MAYKSTLDCLKDLEKTGQLIRIKEEVDPNLDMAEITRRVYRAGGPALLFENVKGSPFPAASNIFGTIDRTNYIFRKSIESTKTAVRFKANPKSAFSSLLAPFRLLKAAINSLPLPVFSAPVMKHETTISKLPQVKSWPDDGGAFITLPQVFTMDPESKSLFNANIGMYRVQLSGNDYVKDQEIGLHYQIHRGIGIHHEKAIKQNKPLKVSIFVGGPPASTFAAVMPLPENLSETIFSGMLAGRSMRFKNWKDYKVAADADFCIVGTIDPRATKKEGPFGDHLGYYSLEHEFPFLKVEKVFHRKNAVWPFTVVGRPPQEDTTFGHLIHEISHPMVPVSILGVKEMHAVDEAGVHPLLLAIGSERYVPYQKRVPMEILTQANAILGFNQASLAKYLLIATDQDDSALTTSNVSKFFKHVLERIDLTRDLHFQTKTTIDTLDYSSQDLNFGSKLVIAAAGEKIRSLSNKLPHTLPDSVKKYEFAADGILMCEFAKHSGDAAKEAESIKKLSDQFECEKWNDVPLVVLVDDADFSAQDFETFLWVTFTRSNPSHDLYGANERFENKHWVFDGPLIIDARFKPHSAPPLIENQDSMKTVDSIIENNPELNELF
jgi:4-hydroxy-3-polyprenylbenzoate decarboxylase